MTLNCNIFQKNWSSAYKEWRQNGGWKYVREQAGRNKPPYEELIGILIRKNIFSGPEWNTQKESDPELQYIPKKLDSAHIKNGDKMEAGNMCVSKLIVKKNLLTMKL